MGWYIRKSVSVGPIRFNISKSGVGASVGVRGFRVGTRPNGTNYVHGGTGGLYYRQDFGGSSGLGPAQPSPSPSPAASPAKNTQTTSHLSANADQLSRGTKHALVLALNHSYGLFRLDFLAMGLASVAFLIGLMNSAGAAFAALGCFVPVVVGVAWWEAKRRTIAVTYDLNGPDLGRFQSLVAAVNHLASCQTVWGRIESQALDGGHQSKLNAGAGSLVKRAPIKIGEGSPPWMQTNIAIPTVQFAGKSFFFLPDCLLVYDSSGVAAVEYPTVQAFTGTTRFIEDAGHPREAQVVDRTWKYPNKDGGPDRRFNGNCELPICQYGELRLSAPNGFVLDLMTSRVDAPVKYLEAFGKARS